MNKPGRGRVCCLWRCSVRRDDEAAELDLDPDALLVDGYPRGRWWLPG